MKSCKLFNSLIILTLLVGCVPASAFASQTNRTDNTFENETISAKQYSEAELQAQHEELEAQAQQGAYVEDEILVVYEQNIPQNIEEESIDELNVADTKTISENMSTDMGKAVLVELEDNQSVADAVIEIEQKPGVLCAQPNYTYSLPDTQNQDICVVDSLDEIDIDTYLDKETEGELQPQSTNVNDPIANITEDTYQTQGRDGGWNQWWLESVGAFEAWDYSRCNNSVTVAVLDTGINFDHKDLKDQIDTEHAYDAVSKEKLTANPEYEYFHGSHVAGIVAGSANNNFGIAGISYNAKILPIQVFRTVETSTGLEVRTDDAILIEAYSYLLGLNLDDLHVINMSLGGYGMADQLLYKVIKEAKDKNIITVCAGGNGDDEGNPYTEAIYPGDYDECVSVVALDSNNVRGTWCDYNEYKDISAPGLYIWSTWYTGNKYARLSGTSMASPIVAGVCALLYSLNPNLTVDEVKEAIYNTATDLGEEGRDDYYGYGKINAPAALQYVSKAHLTCDKSQISKTETIQISASPVDDSLDISSWNWNVDNPEIARVDNNGYLTGLSAGTVTVSATASNDPLIYGRILIDVTELEVTGTIKSTAKNTNGTQFSWNSVSGVTGYEIYRSDTEDGTFEMIDTLDAVQSVDQDSLDSSNEVTYVDSTASPNTVYYYKIHPYGTLDNVRIEGIDSRIIKGLYHEAITSIEGQTRYDTNAQAVNFYEINSDFLGTNTDTIIVASGENFPDAISASSLSGALNVPIVLTNSNSLPSSIAKQISKINPSEIIIIGGSSAISQSVENEIQSLNTNAEITRVYGSTRIKTSEAIYDYAKENWSKTAIIASSTGYADSLSISPYAYKTNSPVFLAESDGGLSPTTRQRLKDGGFEKVIIVGGEGAVSQKAEKIINALGIESTRLGGTNRQETSSLIAQYAIDEGVLTWKRVGFAYAWNYPDALSASFIQGQLGSPLLVVDESNASSVIFNSITQNKDEIDHFAFYGGNACLSFLLRTKLIKLCELDQKS